jgi:TRAP-type mannitol/chloroaromatic compound transport system substrate-binding protein
MKRRDFLYTTSLAALATPAAIADTATLPPRAQIRWKMVTAWPKNLPGPGISANRLAALIHDMSEGRLHIRVYAAGELVPAFEVFDTVSTGTAEMGHAASHYWAGKLSAASFFGGVPFGMTANEMNAWFYHGGGLQLWQHVYAPFGLLPMPAGNAGMQMAGWFRKPINAVADFKGLKMRMSGLGGEVLRRLGALPVTMPVSEVFTALQTGALDAAEFVGPYSDLPIGLYKVAKYYYTPGWNDPGSPLECTINREAYQRLPKDLQLIVATACQAMNNDMLAEYTARNAQALKTLVDDHQVKLSLLPAAVIDALQDKAAQVMTEIAAKDATAARVYAAYRAFARQVVGWTTVSDHAYLNTRKKGDGGIKF